MTETKSRKPTKTGVVDRLSELSKVVEKLAIEKEKPLITFTEIREHKGIRPNATIDTVKLQRDLDDAVKLGLLVEHAHCPICGVAFKATSYYLPNLKQNRKFRDVFKTLAPEESTYDFTY